MKWNHPKVLGGNRNEAWKVEDVVCHNCTREVMVCDSLDTTSDYEWFCRNKECENHLGERTYDQEQPEWVEKLA